MLTAQSTRSRRRGSCTPKYWSLQAGQCRSSPNQTYGTLRCLCCLEGSQTNCSVCLTDTGRSIVVRVFGKDTDRIISRRSELFWQSQFLKTFGVAHNALVYEFLDGYDTLRTAEMPKYRGEIAAALAHFHYKSRTVCCATLPKSDQNFCERFLTEWMSTAADVNTRARMHDAKQQRLYDTLHLSDRIAREVEWLRRTLSGISQELPETVCHNDLLSGNIMRWRGENGASSADLIRLIDFEYAQRNYAYYDIANHFNEYAGLECDWSLFPSDPLMRDFIHVYLRTLKDLNGSMCGESELENERDAERVLQLVKFMTLLSNACWGIWAVIQAAYSTIDFDYMQYAHLRWRRYFSTKRVIVASLQLQP